MVFRGEIVALQVGFTSFFPTKEAPNAPAAESETRPEGGSDFLCSKLRWRLFHRAKPGRGAGLDPGLLVLSARFCWSPGAYPLQEQSRAAGADRAAQALISSLSSSFLVPGVRAETWIAYYSLPSSLQGLTSLLCAVNKR